VETYIPIVGEGNRLPGVDKLELSASGREDKYPGLGGQFDPKLALVYGPIDWIKIRGSWGKSFDAPTSTDKARALSQLQAIGFVPLSPALAGIFTPASAVYPPGLNGLIFLTGTNPALQPQSSTNWAIGSDITPPFVPRLTVSGTYYHILFKDIIGLPTVAGNQAPLFNNYPNLYVYNSAGIPTAQLNALASQAPLSGPQALQQAAGAGYKIIEYIDGRVTNLGLATIAGLDFSANYSMPMSFGELDARFTGNYQLENETRYAPAASPVDVLYAPGAPNLNYSLVLGANIHQLRAQATWNHTSGYAFSPILTAISPTIQTHVDAFDAVNLFFLYALDGPGLAKGLTVTFGVTNVFDANPPIYKSNGGDGFAPNIRTLGRVTQFGVVKQF
jgi:iron complex outermembrane receptor protein